MFFLLFPIPLYANPLPATLKEKLALAKIPLENVAIWIADAEREKTLFSWNDTKAMNPASTMKLVTTYAALDLFGPAYTWKTKVFVDGPVVNDVLRGNLILQGDGDPGMTIERFWLLIREIRKKFRVIEGKLIIDAAAFDNMTHQTIDGKDWRIYNAPPYAMMVNFFAHTLTIKSQASSVQVQLDPPLVTIALKNQVKLTHTSCHNAKEPQVAYLQHPQPMLMVTGDYSPDCGEIRAVRRYLEPKDYVGNLFWGLWQELGGSGGKSTVEGLLPSRSQLLLEFPSKPLAEIIIDTNKFSNNIMAKHLLLTIGKEFFGTPAKEDAGKRIVQRWLMEKDIMPKHWVLDNGAGLSREARITAQDLGRLLVNAWHSRVGPEFVSSLPVIAIDGTMRKRLRSTPLVGRGHIKTGTLRDVKAIAGYVSAPEGLYVVVAIINHPNAGGGGPFLDDVLNYTFSFRSLAASRAK